MSDKHFKKRFIERYSNPDKCGVHSASYACKFCPESFKNRNLLKRHARIHRKCRECKWCKKTFSKQSLMLEHGFQCAYRPSQINSEESSRSATSKPPGLFTCSICQIFFRRRKWHKRHMKLHGRDCRWHCPSCQKWFARRSLFRIHKCISSGDSTSKTTSTTTTTTTTTTSTNQRNIRAVPTYSCRDCRNTFLDRRSLYRHRAKQHPIIVQTGGAAEATTTLQSEPWTPREVSRPWTSDDGQSVTNEGLKECYDINRPIILQRHSEGGDANVNDVLTKKYNFPIARDEIQSHHFRTQLKYIFKRQTHAFKINLSFGLILQNIHTKEYRYFIPYKNTHVFSRPRVIGKYRDLKKTLRALDKLDLERVVLSNRPNTKWKMVMLTNVTYTIYATSYTLGNTTKLSSPLPACLRKKTCLISFSSHTDNLCAFRCLAYHFKKNHKQTSSVSHRHATKRDSVGAHSPVVDSRRLERETHKLFSLWVKETSIVASSFAGLRVPDDIPLFEKLFKVKVNIFRHDCESNHSCVPVYLSKGYTKKAQLLVMNVNMYAGHLSYITNIDTFTQRYRCRLCDRYFKELRYLRKHERGRCVNKTRYLYPGGYFTASCGIFEEIDNLVPDISHLLPPSGERFSHFFAMFDLEAMLIKEQDTELQHKNRFTHRHHPISVAISSNVPDFDTPKCFVNANLDCLMIEMVAYLSEISLRARTLMECKFQRVITAIEKEIEVWKSPSPPQASTIAVGDVDSPVEREVEEEEDELPSRAMLNRLSRPNVFRSFMENVHDTTQMGDVTYNDWDDLEEDDVQTTTTYQRDNKLVYASLGRLKKKFDRYCSQLPVVGFNSSKYDLNLIKARLAVHLGLASTSQSGGDRFIVKKNNQYMCIANEQFRFLDLTQYLPPGTSYSGFLKTFNVSTRKGFFCYEYLDDESKLNDTSLPPIEAFWSSLKNCNVLEDANFQLFDEMRRKNPNKPTCDILKSLDLNEVPACASDNYNYLCRVWHEHGMSTLKDLLVWYNILDVEPGIEAATKLQTFYRVMKVDIFRDAISVPGIARKLIFRSATEQGATFAIFDNANKDLHTTVRRNIVGGPSIVFSRLASSGETRIRDDPSHICKSILGYDANALYLSCLSLDMPVSYFVRWLPVNDKLIGAQRFFKSQVSERYVVAYHWLDWLNNNNNNNNSEQQEPFIIHHKLNSGREKRVGPYLVDGYSNHSNSNDCYDVASNHSDSNECCYDFYGCYWHGHDAAAVNGKTRCLSSSRNKKASELAMKRYARTIQRENYIRSRGYNLVVIWECDFRRDIKHDAALANFIAERQHPFTELHAHKKNVTESDILTAVNNKTLFGMVEIDIHVPPELYEHFAEMSPLFVTSRVSFSVIGDHMQQHAKDHNVSNATRTLLVGGMRAKKLLLATPLLKWYMDHGLHVTRIYQAVEFRKQKCFRKFTEGVTEARRLGDTNSHLSVLGEIQKLIGNSAYGSLLLDKSRHTRCFYIKGVDKAKVKVNDPRFVNVCELDDGHYEFTFAKTSVSLDMPITLGYFVLQYAKQRLLEFYYDFLDVFVDRALFQCMQCDTDSLYIQITSHCLSDIIRPSKKQLFDYMLNGFCDRNDITADSVLHFFPRTCCSTHALRDKRTPGLFKLESQGMVMVCLSSKTYALQEKSPDAATPSRLKLSTKGLNKSSLSRANEGVDVFGLFRSVLTDGLSRAGTNVGFQSRDNTVFTYRQQRWGLSYFYCKREVQSDGVSTRPLQLTLKPAKKT